MPAGLFVALGLSAATAAFVSPLIISVGLSIGFGFISRLLRPDAPAFEAPDATDVTLQPDAPRMVLRGAMIISGVETYRAKRTVGADKWLDRVITLSGHEIAKYRLVYMDVGDGLEFLNLHLADVRDVGSGSGFPMGGDFFSGLLHFEFKRGYPGEPAFPSLITNQPTDWTSDHRQDGCASVYMSVKYSDPKFNGRIPNVAFDILGKPLYDPRDGTVKYDEASIRNPILNIRDHLMMATSEGFMGVPAAEIPDSVIIAQANICDEPVPLADGGTQPRYTLDWFAPYGRDWNQDLEEMLESCAGYMVSVGGFRPYAGVWTPPVLTLTDDDLRGAIEYQSMASARERANTIKGTFIATAAFSEITEFKAHSNPAYVTEDGEVLIKDLELKGTSDGRMAKRLAKQRLEEARRAGILKLKCMLKAWPLVPGDVFGFTHDRFVDAGIWPAAKTFKVLETKLVIDSEEDGPPILGVDIIAKETDAAIYDWSTTDEAA